MPSVALKITRTSGGGRDGAAPPPGKPLFRGTGDTDYLCGNCGAVIALGMGPTQRVPFNSTICAACGAENEFPPSLGG